MNEHPPIDSSRIIVARLTAAMVTIAFAFVLTYLIAWNYMQGIVIFGRAGAHVPSILRCFGEELAEFANKNGRYPESFKEQYKWAKTAGSFSCIMEGDDGNSWGLPLRDPWKNEFQYQSTGRSYRIYAVRRDGTIGSVELTGNLDSNPKGTVRFEPTLHDFLYESRHSISLFDAALFSSIIAGVMCFFLVGQHGTPGCLLTALHFTAMPALFFFVSAVFDSSVFGIIAAITYFFSTKRLGMQRCSLPLMPVWIVVMTCSAVVVSLCFVMMCMVLE